MNLRDLTSKQFIAIHGALSKVLNQDDNDLDEESGEAKAFFISMRAVSYWTAPQLLNELLEQWRGIDDEPPAIVRHCLAEYKSTIAFRSNEEKDFPRGELLDLAPAEPEESNLDEADLENAVAVLTKFAAHHSLGSEQRDALEVALEAITLCGSPQMEAGFRRFLASG